LRFDYATKKLGYPKSGKKKTQRARRKTRKGPRRQLARNVPTEHQIDGKKGRISFGLGEREGEGERERGKTALFLFLFLY
jgi:hypothetical protein